MGFPLAFAIPLPSDTEGVVSVVGVRPTPPGPMSSGTRWELDITGDPSILLIWVAYSDINVVEMAYDGVDFTPNFKPESRLTGSGLSHFVLKRSNGWPSAPTFNLRVLSTSVALSYRYDLVGAGSTAQATAASLGKAQPIGRDLTLDANTHDLLLRGGDLSLVRDSAAIRQEVDVRLSFLLNEWFLDKTVGVPYLQTILVKAPNLAAVRTVLRDEITACVGIRSITTLDLDFNRKTRVLRVTWSATTDLSELVSSEVTI